MAAEDFTQMPLWIKAQEMAASVAGAVATLPRDRAADVIGSQLMRSAGSVPANIAEGYGRYSQAAYRSHLSIARGSLFETQSWLDLLERTGKLPSDTKVPLFHQCQEVGRLLTYRMKTLGSAELSYAKNRKAKIAEGE